MRVRTFESFWLIKNGLISSYPSPDSNEESDIIVIGGGITGALISWSLIQNNYRVILIDKRDIGMGSTSATTGLLQYETDIPLFKLAMQIGEGDAVACYLANIKAINDLAKLIAIENIDCDFGKKESLYISKTASDAQWLYKEYAIRHKYQLGVKWLNKKEVFERYGINCFGAILSETGGCLDAYRFTHNLIMMCIKKGLRVFDQTPIHRFDFSKSRVVMHSNGGYKFTCNKVIYCGGYEATQMLKEHICKLHYTFASISEQKTVSNSTLNNLLVWDTGSPYFYLRTTGDNRLLIGGADIGLNFQVLQNTIKKIKMKQLIHKLNDILPGVEFIEDFSWGGTFGSTKDSLPYIGKSPEYENVLFALGFGGNGIVFSVQAMEIINDLLKAKSNRLARLYRFKR